LDRAEPGDELCRRWERVTSDLLSGEAAFQCVSVIRAGPPYGLHVRR
jgi:hypothetical protein